MKKRLWCLLFFARQTYKWNSSFILKFCSIKLGWNSILSIDDWCGDILQEGQSANQLLAPSAAQIWQIQRIHLTRSVHSIAHISVFLTTIIISMSFRKLLFKLKIEYILKESCGCFKSTNMQCNNVCQ